MSYPDLDLDKLRTEKDFLQERLNDLSDLYDEDEIEEIEANIHTINLRIQEILAQDT